MKLCVLLQPKKFRYNIMKQLRFFTFVMAVLFFYACQETENEPQPASQEQVPDNIYQFKVLDGQGDSVSLATYKGQVLLVVNTATQCGYTPEYTNLERIYETYRDQGFSILDFPCNQFGGQAPGSYDDIHDFCTGTYNITFPQFAKIKVNGSGASPLYVWLKSKKPGDIPWNFTKFLVDRKGNVVSRHNTGTSMAVVENAIVDLL